MQHTAFLAMQAHYRQIHLITAHSASHHIGCLFLKAFGVGLQALGPELSVPDKDRVCLKWDKVSCTLKNKKHQRHLLQGVCGAAKPGR
jgi:hypothetical protein